MDTESQISQLIALAQARGYSVVLEPAEVQEQDREFRTTPIALQQGDEVVAGPGLALLEEPRSEVWHLLSPLGTRRQLGLWSGQPIDEAGAWQKAWEEGLLSPWRDDPLILQSLMGEICKRFGYAYLTSIFYAGERLPPPASPDPFAVRLGYGERAWLGHGITQALAVEDLYLVALNLKTEPNA
jgi:hypothetical protein